MTAYIGWLVHSACSKTWSSLVLSGLILLVWSGLYGLFIGLVSIFLFFTISFLQLIYLIIILLIGVAYSIIHILMICIHIFCILFMI